MVSSLKEPDVSLGTLWVHLIGSIMQSGKKSMNESNTSDSPSKIVLSVDFDLIKAHCNSKQDTEKYIRSEIKSATSPYPDKRFREISRKRCYESTGEGRYFPVVTIELEAYE